MLLSGSDRKMPQVTSVGLCGAIEQASSRAIIGNMICTSRDFRKHFLLPRNPLMLIRMRSVSPLLMPRAL